MHKSFSAETGQYSETCTAAISSPLFASCVSDHDYSIHLPTPVTHAPRSVRRGNAASSTPLLCWSQRAVVFSSCKEGHMRTEMSNFSGAPTLPLAGARIAGVVAGT